LKVPVWNSSSVLRWNADKQYLLDLAARGVATVPTRIVPASASANDVEAVATQHGWTRVVVKPAVSASGYETHAFRVPFDDAACVDVERAARHGSLLVQPFIDEVPREGEFSFTFIDGVLSHATRKRAMPGEFRVQTEHGGSVEAATADDRTVREAHAAIDALPQVPLYARVDGVVREGAFLLMELELIEPNLFLSFAAGAMDRFARAIAGRVESCNSSS
jgi:glutathione synthase/RimK-type ligase-like ATP-grasp enzyme